MNFYGELTLETYHVVRCGCGYSRRLSDSELANFRRGEEYFGSKKCPACGCGGYQGSAAQWNESINTHLDKKN